MENSSIINIIKLISKFIFLLLIINNPIVYAATTESSDSNFVGDRISFPVKTEGKYKDGKCLLPRTPGDGILDTDSYKAISLSDKVLKIYSTKDIECLGDQDDSDGTLKTIPAYESIDVDYTGLSSINRYGFAYGALIVPYKYYWNSEEFKGSTSIGPYMGYRFDPMGSIGIGAKFVIFAGITNIEIQNSSGSTSNVTGFSYGGGLLGNIKNTFQFGLIAGADRVSKSDDFDNNGKLWVAFAIGFDFSN